VSPAGEDRIFENAVPLDAEALSANRAHFEGKGYSVSETEPKEEPSKDAAPAEGTEVEGEKKVVTDSGAEGDKEPAQPPADDMDPEDLAEWQSAHSDEEKRGRYAKRSQKIRTLYEQIEQLKTKNSELKGRLDERTSITTTSSTDKSQLQVQEVDAKADGKSTDATEMERRPFSKERPRIPLVADFADADDPIQAHSEALAKALEERDQWIEEKFQHESTEERRIAEARSRAESEKQEQARRKSEGSQRLEDARKRHSDFDERTGQTGYAPILNHILVNALPDGYDLAYELTLPENAQLLEKLNQISIAAGDDPRKQNSAALEVTSELARYSVRKELSGKKAEPNPPSPAQPPSKPQTRVEEVTERHYLKGSNGSVKVRIEDVDSMDSDARRALKKTGQLA